MAMSVVYTTFGGMLVHENRGGTERQYISDPLGSLVGELDSTQAVTYTAEYWPYGEIQTETGTNTSNWSFVGLLGYLKDLASLLYVRARHYLPQKARWLTVDPLWPGESSYAYSLNAPIYNVDIDGSSPSQIHISPNDLLCLGRCIGEGLRYTGKYWTEPIRGGLVLHCDCGPDCPKPPVTSAQAWNKALGILKAYGNCKRIKQGHVNPAERCTVPGTGTHKTDIYLCGKKKVSVSVLCCPCAIGQDHTGESCVPSVHDAN